MADYRPSRRDGLSNYLNEIGERDAYGNPIRSTAERESLPRDPSPFEEDVRIIYDELMSILLAKHRDYGPKNIAHSPGGALNGLRVRLWDKIARINNLLDSGVAPSNESLRDSFIDLLNYSAIAILVLDDKWPKE